MGNGEINVVDGSVANFSSIRRFETWPIRRYGCDTVDLGLEEFNESKGRPVVARNREAREVETVSFDSTWMIQRCESDTGDPGVDEPIFHREFEGRRRNRYSATVEELRSSEDRESYV